MVTYVLQHPLTNLLKVGKTTNLNARLRTLNTGAGARLKVIGTVNGDCEALFHAALEQDHAYGEWFHPTIHARGLIERALGHGCAYIERAPAVDDRPVKNQLAEVNRKLFKVRKLSETQPRVVGVTD